MPVLVSLCEGDVVMNWYDEVHLQGQRNKYHALTSGLHFSTRWLCYWKSDCFILKSCLRDKLLFQIKLSRSLSHLFVSKETQNEIPGKCYKSTADIKDDNDIFMAPFHDDWHRLFTRNIRDCLTPFRDFKDGTNAAWKANVLPPLSWCLLFFRYTLHCIKSPQENVMRYALNARTDQQTDDLDALISSL